MLSTNDSGGMWWRARNHALKGGAYGVFAGQVAILYLI
jgi:hypothetical protein